MIRKDSGTHVICGCMGCIDDAVARIRHPDKGERTVCEHHLNDYPILEAYSADIRGEVA